MHTAFGPIVLLGSGETSLVGGRIYESIAQNKPNGLRIAVMETPAGFELNSSRVAGRVAEFLAVRLQNYQPTIEVVKARRRNTPFSPDDPDILKPLLQADMIFMGAGSPTYAVRQLSGSLAWNLIRARHRLGAALIFASAATVAVGAFALPVYEIFKVGEEVTCPPGLDLFGDFGLAVSCVPHWNNTDGGEDVDTSRCFIGIERFDQWCAMLPENHTVLGLDEHTGILLDFNQGIFTVAGVSSVTILKSCVSNLYPAGSTCPISVIGNIHCPAKAGEKIPESVWETALRAAVPEVLEENPPPEVVSLLEQRALARENQEWTKSDKLREAIQKCGWQVRDTPGGQKVFRMAGE